MHPLTGLCAMAWNPLSDHVVSHDYLPSRMKRPTNITLPTIIEGEKSLFPCADPLKSTVADEVSKIGSYPTLKPIALSTCNEANVRKEQSQLPSTFLSPFEYGDHPGGFPLDPSMASPGNSIAEPDFDETLKRTLTGSLPQRFPDFSSIPPKASLDSARSVVSSENSRSSVLSPQIDHLSKLSSEERDFIKSLLKHFTVSTSPPLSSSMLSRLSIRSIRVFEGSMDEPLMFHPLRAIMKLR